MLCQAEIPRRNSLIPSISPPCATRAQLLKIVPSAIHCASHCFRNSDRYTALVGRPSLPPLWALGYWQSKCTYYDWTQLDEAYGRLSSRGFPVDIMLGKLSQAEMLRGFGMQALWTLVFIGTRQLTWRHGLRRYSAVGA